MATITSVKRLRPHLFPDQLEALRLSARMIGLFAGLLLSAADAVIMKAYVPILVLGALGGAVIG